MMARHVQSGRLQLHMGTTDFKEITDYALK